MNSVERAIALAVEQHAGQVDKQGVPYILHVLRVVGRVSLETDCTEDALVVAALHDVIEDSAHDWNAADLSWLSDEAKVGLYAVTRLPHGETYNQYIERLMPNAIARMVKMADLRDNLDRLPGLPASDKERLFARYMNALTTINAYEMALPSVGVGEAG